MNRVFNAFFDAPAASGDPGTRRWVPRRVSIHVGEQGSPATIDAHASADANGSPGS